MKATIKPVSPAHGAVLQAQGMNDFASNGRQFAIRLPFENSLPLLHRNFALVNGG